MKRLAFTGPTKAEILEYQDRPLKENEVLVKTELASGKHGTTMGMLQGGNFDGVVFDQDMRVFVDAPDQPAKKPSRENPIQIGTTGIGTVVEVGEKVTKWSVGDRVFGMMDVRETNIVHENSLWELGDISEYTALCVEPAYVAFHAVRESNVRFGEKVAVIGLGALGLIAVQMAKLSGAEQVIAVDGIKKRRDLAIELGADEALDAFADEDIAVRIHELTGGSGVDIAIELAGAYPALNTAIRSTRVGGTICSAGFYDGEARGIWLGREWHHNRLTMVVPHGCGWGHEPRDYPRWSGPRALDTIVSMMRKKRLNLDQVIYPVVPFEKGPEVLEAFSSGSDDPIKFAVAFS